jgi:hypothetical protein
VTVTVTNILELTQSLQRRPVPVDAHLRNTTTTKRGEWLHPVTTHPPSRAPGGGHGGGSSGPHYNYLLQLLTQARRVATRRHHHHPPSRAPIGDEGRAGPAAPFVFEATTHPS